MRTSPKFTYEDLQQIPRDSWRYELVDGELFVTPAPIPLHQRIVGNVFGQLWQHVRQHRLGEVFVSPCDIVFTPITVLEPDVFFVSRARFHIIGEKNLSGPPDLVVEVLSEFSTQLDQDIKFKKYAQHGVPEFWLFDPPGKTLKVFRLKKRKYELIEDLGFGDTLTSPLFPGLTLSISSLWER